MDQNVEPNQPQVTTPPTEAPPQPPVIDPREYDILQRELQGYRNTLTVLDPHAERIRKLVENPEAARLFDNALNAYEKYQESQGPQIPDEQRPLYDKVSKLEKFVDDYAAQQKAAAEAPQRQAAQALDAWSHDPANERFYQRLRADHPTLVQDDWTLLSHLAGANNYESLEDTWKKYSWRFVREQSSAPPSSLRTDAGEPGTAGEARPGAQSARERVIELERERRGIA
jgi:hypothetical protein